VTARAVRQRAQVAMTVAAEAARAWNEAQAEAEAVPEVPEVVTRRFEAAWREAVTTAREEFAEARSGWQTRLETADAELGDLAKLVETLEAELAEVNDAAQRAKEEAQQAREGLQEQIVEHRSRADRAEAKVEVLTEERDRLLAEREKASKDKDESR